MLDLLGQDVDLIILARYWQILSPEFVGHYLLRLIDIHSSFLNAFVGALALPQGIRARSETDRRYQPLRHRRSG